MPQQIVLSRHRLPHFYRVGLCCVWAAPPALFAGAILLSRGLTPGLIDPRFLLPALLLLLPAAYIWREGVDVLPTGLVVRVLVPRYYPYTGLKRWELDRRPQRQTLTVWDQRQRKALECRAAHLTNVSALLEALHQHLDAKRQENSK